MPWLCSNCGKLNSNLDSQCKICESRFGEFILHPHDTDSFEVVNRILIYELGKFGIQGEKEMSASDTMTREEKLFAKFFNDEKILVSQMDDFALKAHIEELQDIAREARARLTCSTGEDRERSAKKRQKKGISETVESDDFTSEAINNIQKRAQKMSKTEKEIERLVSMGISRTDAENMYKATTINKVQKEGAAAVLEENKRLDVQVIVNSVMNPNPPAEGKAFINPFATQPEKPKETLPESQTQPLEEPTKVEAEGLVKILPVVEKEEKEEPKPKFVNPFAK